MKKPFINLKELKEIVKKYPTPFHLYDESGIRENANLREAFRGIKFRIFCCKLHPIHQY